MNYWSVAFAAAGFGLLIVAFAVLRHARSVADSKLTRQNPSQALTQRVIACEELLQEMVQALAKIEARDKMRRVRAAKVDGPTDPASSGQNSTVSSLPTPELRRQLAMSRLRK